MKMMDVELERPDTIKELMICSATEVCVVDRPRIIGERINPTGKKKFKEALLNNDIDYILNQAIEQVNAGAEILDVNVGLPNIDEKEMMRKVIKSHSKCYLRSITDRFYYSSGIRGCS